MFAIIRCVIWFEGNKRKAIFLLLIHCVCFFGVGWISRENLIFIFLKILEVYVFLKIKNEFLKYFTDENIFLFVLLECVELARPLAEVNCCSFRLLANWLFWLELYWLTEFKTGTLVFDVFILEDDVE